MNLLLVRHGEIPSNIKGIYAGRSSEQLTERGLVQSKEVSDALIAYNVKTLYSSPIQRALQTAKIISDMSGVDIIIDSAFREMELGPWEGLSEAKIAKSYPNEWQLWQTTPAELKLPGRETLEELLRRVLKGVQNIYNYEGDSSIVVVSHVAVIRVLLLWHKKRSLNFYKTLEIPNAQIFEIGVDHRTEELMFFP